MGSFKNKLKKLLIFEKPNEIKPFVLNEDPIHENFSAHASNQDQEKKANDSEEKKSLPKKGLFNKIFHPFNNDNSQQEQAIEIIDTSKIDEIKISKKLDENLEIIKSIYNIPINSDVLLRDFQLTVKDKSINGFIVFIDGMTDRTMISENILNPLMIFSNFEIKSDSNDLSSFIKKHLLTYNQIKESSDFNKVIEEVNFGGCGIFIEGLNVAFTADVKGWEHRSIDRPTNEMVIRGPAESFSELLRTNVALIRKILKDTDLISETILVGTKSKTPCAILYIKNIANSAIVKEVKRRISSLEVDYIIDSGELEQLIEDNTYFPFPQASVTERSDKTAALLADGKVAIILQGSPYAIIVPISVFDLVTSPEDSYIRFPYSNLIRIIRVIAMFISLLLPSLYLAVTTFHQEMIPTDLLLAIQQAREKVPFPTVFEILLMEISFELIREAGIRVPGPIGPTLGIIGALILGQAAVAANIVSPILIIIVAMTGIGSFAIPSFSLAFSFRTLRFIYIILGSFAGFLGITFGLFIQGLYLAAGKSFGVPLLSPFAPFMRGGFTDHILRAPIWKQERRPDYLNPKKINKQPKIARKWRFDDPEVDSSNEK